MKKPILALSAAMLFMGSLYGQDIHFTQYGASPLTLNPAMAGIVESDFRATINHRQQWSSVAAHPDMTSTVSYDMGLLKGKLPKGDAIGIGVMGFYNNPKIWGPKNKTVGLSLAYHRAFGRNKLHHLSLGFQANVVRKEFEHEVLTFGIPTSYFVTDVIHYPDLNAGAMYSGKVSARSTAYIGYSFYHLTQPVEIFLGNDHQIHARHTVNMGGTYDITQTLVLYANAMYEKQAEAQEIVVGTTVSYTRKNTTFSVGGWYRYEDALSPYLAAEWRKMRIGLSYDVNVSSFAPATHSTGAIELSAIFSGNINKRGSIPNYNRACPKIF
jgi:type IX secretion system PorP/SprF family membrane protein